MELAPNSKMVARRLLEYHIAIEQQQASPSGQTDFVAGSEYFFAVAT